jgi:8-oxo-dGTP pyrophosphatase MutT (NUDIX family)
MIYHEEPVDFKSKFDVVSCFIINAGKTLFIRRSSQKPQGGTWGIPAGKIEKDEDGVSAVLREVREETGIKLEKKAVKYFKTLFVRYPSYDFKYYMYSSESETLPAVEIDPRSHTEFSWLSPQDALKLDLIQDEDHCIKLFFNIN